MPAFIPIALLIGAKAFVARYVWVRRWRSYDPGWLVSLARKQCPRKKWLAAALTRCTWARDEGPCYVRFKPSQAKGTRARRAPSYNNITLKDDAEGDVVVDVRPDGEVSGIEFRTRRRKAAAEASRK
jgi:uncharacterized protein YuzE